MRRFSPPQASKDAEDKEEALEDQAREDLGARPDEGVAGVDGEAVAAYDQATATKLMEMKKQTAFQEEIDAHEAQEN